MAIVYVRSGATGAGTGTSWTDALLALAGPAGTGGLATAVAAGTTPPTPVWQSEDHVEPQYTSATTLTGGASQAASIPILCVNHTTNALATAATPITSANGVSVTLAGWAYVNGISISVGNGGSGSASILSSTSSTGWSFDTAGLTLNSTSPSSLISIGSSSSVLYKFSLSNTSVTFGAVGQSINLYSAAFSWKNTAAGVGGSIYPTNLFTAQRLCSMEVEAVGLSAIPSGKSILLASGTSAIARVTFKDCSLASGVTRVSGALQAGSRVSFIRCDSGSGNYIEQVYAAEGSQVDELSVTLVGGATDNYTPKSRKFVTSAASIAAPFESNISTIWWDASGSAITVVLEGIWGSATRPNDNDIWLEAEYLGAVGGATPLGAVVSSNATSVVTATGTGNTLPTSSATWNNTPGTSSKFKLSVTLTPTQKGFLTLRIKAAANNTFYVDPSPAIGIGAATPTRAASRSYVGPSGALINETASTSPGASVYIPMIDYVSV